ncbi:S8 family peptidase [Streptomyces lincolnensis]|uniref:S8 family peptidase n=1 Tax=Streptomyces lincolnensis TaxID=1915 RepID=UPI0037CD8B6B
MNNNRRRAALAATVLLSAFSLGSAPAQAADAGASGPAQRVIVVMRDQLTDLPMHTQAAKRGRAAAADQAPVVALLKESGATHVSGMSLINAVSATLKPDAIARIRGDRDVAAVVPDLPIRRPATDRATTASAATSTSAAAKSGIACPKDPAKPLAEPEALRLTHTDAAQRTATGKGVKVAFFAEGMDAGNPEFIRPDGSHVVTDTEDFSGDGVSAPTSGGEAFGDASSIAAQGSRTYDLAKQLPHAKLPKGCTFTVRGFAPDAQLMDLRVFGEHSFTSGFVRAIQYAVEHHADVLSQSFGGNLYPDAATDPVRLADDAAIAAGVTVVASSGDSGTSGTVGSPASDPRVIGVGATTSFRLAAQGYGYRGWTSDNIAALSSGGTTPDNKLVDLVAPGMVGMSACTVDPRWADCALPTQVFGGTSQAAPFVAGAAADVIQAYADTHGGAKPSPDLVKRILTGTATDLRTPADEQGAGLLNTHAAVQAARALNTVGGHAGQLVPSVGQLSVTGHPGGTEHSSVSLTNTADRPQRVTMTSRTVGAQTFRTQRKVTVGAPLAGDAQGKLAAKPFTVRVPKGTPLLDAEMVWPGTAKSGKLALVLIDPAGRLTQVSYDYDGYGLHSNYQHVDVHDPRPGTWTVKLVWDNGRMHLQDKPIKPGSYRGPVDVRITGHRYTSAGVPTQSRTVPAGGTATFPVRIPFARTAGDTPFSLQFASETGTRLSLPVARRTLIPVDPAAGHSTSFAATITGGVGRDVGQTNGYYIDVPPGRRGLTIDLAAEDPAATLVYYLVSPDGQILARDTDRTAGEHSVPTKYASLTANRPAAGRWTLIVGLPDAVSGKVFSQRVTGTVRLDAVTATAPGLPNSPTRVLKRGSTLTVPVRVPNSSPAQRSYYLDPRLDTTGEIKVPVWGDDKSGTVQINQGGPTWMVPSHTTELVATATAGRPVDLEIYPWTGAPAVFAPAGPTGTTVATATAGQLTSGSWFTDVSDPGPFGNKPAGKGTAKVSLTATTQSFDPAAKASTGAFWDPDADWKPVTAAAGKTATMKLTLTPTAPVGTVVHGTVYVATDVPLGSVLGSELIGIPYTYTVG